MRGDKWQITLQQLRNQGRGRAHLAQRHRMNPNMAPLALAMEAKSLGQMFDIGRLAPTAVVKRVQNYRGASPPNQSVEREDHAQVDGYFRHDYVTRLKV